MDSFYMYLPSNVDDVTGKNTIANFVTQLPQVSKLYGKWEVGLAEILITKTWFNIVQDEEVRLMTSNAITTHVCKVPAGCYRDHIDILRKISECMEYIRKMYLPKNYLAPIVEFTVDRRRIVMYPGYWEQKNVLPYLSPSLLAILGFDPFEEHDFEKKVKVGNASIKGARVSERELNIDATIKAIYVYCDIIKSSVVGDTLSKLLRVVSVPSVKFGETIQNIFEQPLYFPLEKKEFQSIEIDLKDDAGESLKFDGGRVIVVLHFRKKYE